MVNNILSVFHWLLLQQHSSFLKLFLSLYRILLLFISCIPPFPPPMPTLLLSEKVVFVSPKFLRDYFFLILLRAVKRGCADSLDRRYRPFLVELVLYLTG